ncbi:MAG: hypothetical protein Q8O83_02715 [bacterium]|nr:hypothetical protein [bacterium]
MRAFLVTLIVVLLTGFLLQAPFDRLKENDLLGEAGALQANSIAAKKARVEEIFNSVSLEAKGVIVQEYPSGNVLFARDEHALFPLASVAKLMTALTAQEAEQNKPSPFPLVVPITEGAVRQEGDSGFLAGETFYVEDLIDIMLANSSNDAAFAIAGFSGDIFAGQDLTEKDSVEVFIQRMNIKKNGLGLFDLQFSNVTGLDIDEENNVSGAYGSPAHVAGLVALLLRDYPFMLERTQQDVLVVSSSDSVHSFENTNYLASSIPGLRASKTGYTELAGGNLAVAIDIGFGRTVIIVVLASSFDGRFSDIERLYNATLEYYRE